MTSTRPIVFDLGTSDDKIIQLGSTVQKRGVIKEGDVNHPRATAANLNVPAAGTILISPGASSETIFNQAAITGERSFIGDNIVYGSMSPPRLLLPYAGVSSVYEVRVRLDYQFGANPTGGVVLQVDMIDFAGTPITRRIRTEAVTQFGNTLDLDFIERIREVTQVLVTNETNSGLVLFGEPSPHTTYLEVSYLGAN